jgi:hypothetical protein
MNKKLIVLIVAVLAIAIVLGFAIPALLTQGGAQTLAEAGSEIFGNGTGTSPPSLP